MRLAEGGVYYWFTYNICIMDRNEINERPSGYLIMDTCCFLNYIEGERSDAFEYEEIKKFIERNKLWLVITPYTLYECIQSCVTEESIKQRGQKMLEAWEFWVLNINGLIGEPSFEFGPDFVFSLNVGVGPLKDFVEKRSAFREKVYHSLVPRMTLLAQLIAVIYLMITEVDEHGNYPRGFEYRIKLIMGQYFQSEPNFRVQLYSFIQYPDRMGLVMKDGLLAKTWDAKDKFNEFVQNWAIQIIAVSKVIMDEKLADEDLDVGELNARIVKELNRTVGQYNREAMVKQYKLFGKKFNKLLTIDSLVDQAMPNGDAVFNHLFKKVVGNWFLPGGQGKTLVNTIIDYVNLGVVEKFGKAPVIYMTEEKAFVDLALCIKDESFRLTQAYYKKYYKRKPKV